MDGIYGRFFYVIEGSEEGKGELRILDVVTMSSIILCTYLLFKSEPIIIQKAVS